MRLLGFNVDRFVADTGNLPYSLLNTLGLREAMIRRLQADVRPAPLIFVASSGRAGSGYLAALFDATANGVADHEPRPRITGKYVRGLSQSTLASTYDRRRIKIVQVLRRLRSLPAGFCYAETSHMFVKTYYDVVLDHFSDVKIVHLRRRLPAVIKSFAELGYFSDASTHWRHWMHDPYDSEPLVPPLVEEHEADSFDRIIAYLIDIEARAGALRDGYPKAEVVNAELEELTNPETAERLVTRLGLEWSDDAAAICTQRANLRSRMKQTIGRSVDVEYCRERLERYVAQAEERSQPLPDLLI